MKNDDLTAQLKEEVEQFTSFYAVTPHAIKVWGAIILVAIAGLSLPVILRQGMCYVNLSRDITVLEAEANVNRALLEAQTALSESTSSDFSKFVATQNELWNKQMLLLAQLEKKIPKPDIIDTIMKYTGVIAGMLAFVAGLSTTVVAWKRERRETRQFLMQLQDRLTALETKSSKVIVP